MKVYTVTFERDYEDDEMAEKANRSGAAQLAAELQEACDAGFINGTFKVQESFPSNAATWQQKVVALRQLADQLEALPLSLGGDNSDTLRIIASRMEEVLPSLED